MRSIGYTRESVSIVRIFGWQHRARHVANRLLPRRAATTARVSGRNASDIDAGRRSRVLKRCSGSLLRQRVGARHRCARFRKAAGQSPHCRARKLMTASCGARLSARRWQTTGERRGPGIRSENGDRPQRVDSSRRTGLEAAVRSPCRPSSARLTALVGPRC